jgi:signal transduction histidine kinase
MSVRTRLLVAQLPMALALALLGAYAVSSVSTLGRTAQTILAENFRSVLAAQRMQEALERMDSAALFAAAGQPERGLAQAREHEQVFERELRVEESNITEPGERELAARLRELWTDYRAALAGCLAAAGVEAARDCYFRELEPRFVATRRVANAVLLLNQDAMALKSERARQQSGRIGAQMTAAALLAPLLGIALSWLLTSRILRPLSVLEQAVDRFGGGDFAARAFVRGHDEIARLATTFNAMADRIEEYRRSSLGQLLQAQLASQAAIDSIPDPVLIFGPDGTTLSSNRAADALFGARGGSPRLADLEPAVRDVVDRVRAHVLQGKGSYAPPGFEEAVAVERADGERYFLPRAEPVYEEKGGIAAATVILQDVTRLRRVDQLRSDLVATVAHEFRTPLTSLRMAIHLCLEGVAGALAERQADLLYAAREECERLQRIVDDLLDLARLQTGQIQIDAKPTAAASLVETAARAQRAVAQERGLELRLEPIAPDLRVLADPERIQLVLSNLIGNAIHHSPRGGAIELGAREQDSSVRFRVSDRGPGIAKEEQTRVFERFYRGVTARPGGAGLGLAIARDVVQAHGGAIGVESEPGEGATFWFTLPRSD